jgi:uncharacterized membrane protein
VKISWKVLFAFTGIFAAGAVTGAFVGVPLMHRAAPKPIMADQLKKITEQLDLSSVQRDKIRPILKQATEDLRETRKEAFKATTGILEHMEASISNELTDAQRFRFNEMQAQERERRKQWIIERPKQQRGDNRPSDSTGDGKQHGFLRDHPASTDASTPPAQATP